MITVFGIKHCDTMKKSFTWLQENFIAYEFHDYKKRGISLTQLQQFINTFGVITLINTKGTTFKKLSTTIQQHILSESDNFTDYIIAQPSMLKRPIILGASTALIGFNSTAWQQVLLTS
jgi:arsenate reductase (glutaredoxin)